MGIIGIGAVAGKSPSSRAAPSLEDFEGFGGDEKDGGCNTV
jgi:hypothetical protein